MTEIGREQLRTMALNQMKEQVLSLFQSVLTLDITEQTEVMGFLQDCITKFGLFIPNAQTGTHPSIINDKITNVNGLSIDATLLTDKNVDGQISQIFSESSTECDNLPQIDLPETAKTLEELKEKTSVMKHEDECSLVNSRTFECNENEDKKGEVTNLKSNRNEEAKTMKNKNIGKKGNTTRVKKKPLEVDYEGIDDVENDGSDDEEKEILKCPGCSIICQTKPVLLDHMKCHTDSEISCKNCKNTFPNILKFWEHQKSDKCKSKELVCCDCNMKFKRRRHYLKHMLGHKDNNCRYCEEKFSTWAQYKVHVKEKHPDVKIERDLIPCKFCPMSFHRHIGLYNHYRVKHSKGKFVCLSCGLLLPTKEKHKEHVQVHESEKNWKCKICKMKFYRRQQLLLHVSIHKLGIYKCLTCDITVTSKTDLQKHKKDGHEVKGLEKKFECEICHKAFAKRFTLSNHLATHSKDKCYTCKYCVKSFRTLDSLNRHEKRKSHFEKAKITIPESKYEKVYEDKLICEKCGKQYKTQRELKCHLIVHKSVYECNECGKTFTLKFNLTKHLRRHRNPVGVVCELCGDTFNQMSALNEHCLMKHSDVRKAKCDICQKAFKRKSELNRHLRTHEFKRPFVCFCGKAYKQSAHLQNHYKSDHGNSKEPPSQPQHEVVQPPPPQPPSALIDNTIHDFQTAAPTEMYRDSLIDKRKKVYVDGEPEPLVPLDNIESETVFRPSASYMGLINDGPEEKVSGYVSNFGMRYPQGEMEPLSVNYEDLNFGTSQPDKRGLVFTSPAVDLSMVNIPEVVENGMGMGDGHRDVEESVVEPFNKMSDDSSQIQLLNLSEHIVQEYLLNLQ